MARPANPKQDGRPGHGGTRPGPESSDGLEGHWKGLTDVLWEIAAANPSNGDKIARKKIQLKEGTKYD